MCGNFGNLVVVLMVVVWGVFVEGWLSHILLFDAELWPCVCLWFSQLLTEVLYTLGGSVLCSVFVGVSFVTASYDQRENISPNYSPGIIFSLPVCNEIYLSILKNVFIRKKVPLCL